MAIADKAVKTLRHLVKREMGYHRCRPTHLLLFLTYRCTGRCKTCTMWQRTSEKPEMSLEQWKNFIDTVAPLGIQNVEMFGGDALLRKDVLVPLTGYIRRKGIPEVDLVTNGNLMDRDTVRDLVSKGISTVFLSVDGVEGLQDAVRGSDGAFQKAINTIAYLKDARGMGKTPRIALNCTVSALNVNGFEKLIDFARDQEVDAVAFEYAGEFPAECLERSAVNGIAPQPYFVSQGSSILVNRQEAIALKQKLRRIKEEKNRNTFAVITKNIDTLTIENLTRGKFPNKKCYICRYMITVDPFGNILPCAFYNNYHLGNVCADEFKDIWKNKAHRTFVNAVDRGKAELCRY
ncbi:MAG: radical SAM protein [Candidatus Omnitrophica bacterium]|nr:radical SAM protein [Candidatus Omnitrophota bacterium]